MKTVGLNMGGTSPLIQHTETGRAVPAVARGQEASSGDSAVVALSQKGLWALARQMQEEESTRQTKQQAAAHDDAWAALRLLKKDQGSFLARLNEANEAARTQKKAAARAQVQRIKQQIEAMRKMAAGLSPEMAKAMASQIRQLARQLRAAASALLEEGGGNAAVPVSVGGSGQAAINPASQGGPSLGEQGLGGPDLSASTDSETGAEAEGGSEQVADTRSSSAAMGERAAEGAAGATDAAEDAALKAEAEAALAANAGPESSGPEGVAGAEVMGEKADGAGEPVTSSHTRAEADQETQADRALLQEASSKLKQLLALIRSQLKPDADNTRTVKETEAALAEIDKQLSESAGGADAGMGLGALTSAL